VEYWHISYRVTRCGQWNVVWFVSEYAANTRRDTLVTMGNEVTLPVQGTRNEYLAYQH
jgi:hypothetical protein